MPNTDAAKKAQRQNEKRRERNKRKKKNMKDTIKKFEEMVESGKASEAREFFSDVQKIIDKMAKANLIHENKAARLKSRLKRKLESQE